MSDETAPDAEVPQRRYGSAAEFAFWRNNFAQYLESVKADPGEVEREMAEFDRRHKPA